MDPIKIKNKIIEIFDNPIGKPTDIIGWNDNGKKIAKTISPIISEREICFFDEDIRSDEVFHYLDFPDMLEKSEIMIFAIELPEKYHKDLDKLNKKVKIFIPKNFEKTILILKEKGYNNNIILL